MAVSTHNPVFSRIWGHTLNIPDLTSLYSRWPSETSPYFEKLKHIVESKIQEWIPESDEHIRRKARKCDLAVFVSTWYPRSSLDRLQTICWFTLWLFLWDDVIEDTMIPSSVEEDDKVAWLHQQALAYIAHELALVDLDEAPTPPTKYCSLFKHAAGPLRADSHPAERKRFYDEIKNYMDGCEKEQVFVRDGLPSIQEYWEFRYGAAGISPYNALAEYMSGSRIGEELFDTPALQALWLETSRHIVASNDLISYAKEVHKCWPSLIPIIMNETECDLDMAVNSLINTLQISADNVEQASTHLLAMVDHDPVAHAKVEAYLTAFHTVMTGNHWWSISCARYGVAKYIQTDGTLRVPL